jgi:hypothetical protein
LEQFLLATISTQEDSWSPWLPLAEFVPNNHQSEIPGVTPFFANKGSYPHLNFDITE